MRSKTIKPLLLFSILLLSLFTGCLDQGSRQIINKPIVEDIEAPEKPSVNGTELEKLTHELINEEREERNLSALEWNGELAAVARAHSSYLADREENYNFTKNIYISHTGKDGEKHSYRIDEAHIYYINGSAENVAGISAVDTYYEEDEEPASYYNSTEIAERAVEGWMNSTGHRENILTPEFEEAGMGIATDPTETNFIFTQLFINRADCGYLYGDCCGNACFTGLRCKQTTEGKKCLNATE